MQERETTESVDSVTRSPPSDIEREPLLNSRSNYVDPDDPIVSPLNLDQIKLLRVFLVAILGFNCLSFFSFWSAISFLSPGSITEGRLFLELDLTILNIATGLVTYGVLQFQLITREFLAT